MQVIKKNICIEDYRSRLETKVPSCDGESPIYYTASDYASWGRIPYDIIIDEDGAYKDLIDISKNLPLAIITTKIGVTGYVVINGDGNAEKVADSVDGEVRYVLKYKTMSDRYSLLKKLMREAKYYRLCLIRGEYKWVELSESVWENEFGVTVDNPDGTENDNINSDKFFAIKDGESEPYKWLMYSELPSMDESETTYCCVWEGMETFLSYFRLENSDNRYEEVFFRLVGVLYTDEVNEFKFIQPYLSLQLCLSEDLGLLSTYRPYIQEWKPKKRFYVGDHVHYVMDRELDEYGNTYRLMDTPDLETEYVDIPFNIYNALGRNTAYRNRVRENNGKFKLSVKYYKGYFDEPSLITYFDELDENGNILVDASGNTTHWKLCTSSDIEPESDVLSAITDSYLTFLQRKKRSFDDDGNELPFVIDDLSSNNTELNYLLGAQSVEVDGNYKVCDLLQTINFYEDDSSAATYTYEYVDGETPEPIKAMDSDRPSDCEYIGFEYYDDCRVINDSADTTTGVLHKEIYHFTLKTMYANVNSANGELVWAVTEKPQHETVQKLPSPSANRYGRVYKFQYVGLPDYREMGDVVEIVNDGSPTLLNVSVGDMAICLSGDTHLYMYTDIYTDTDGTILYGWIPKECVNGDAYHFVNTIYNPSTGTRVKTGYGNMYMFDNGSWIDMTTNYGISKNNMAYNYGTGSYELFKNGYCYTLQTKFTYIDINYSETYHWDEESERFIGDTIVLSRIYYYGDNTLHDEFQNVPIFYDEGNGSTVDSNGKDSCDIERGSSAAYERHWVLGEVNTFQDLLEYKNNLFGL